MSKFTEHGYYCDFCKWTKNALTVQKTSHLEIDGWFIVRLRSQEEKHACCDCGHHLHSVLYELSIEHKFICKQYDYTDVGLIILM